MLVPLSKWERGRAQDAVCREEVGMIGHHTGHKRGWVTPALVVLTRGAPEETVLVACKVWPAEPMGPNTNVMRCEERGDCSYVFCQQALSS
jgi:hypothetical protein